MILYAILGVLFVGSLVILITHSYRPNTARSWLIAMITALLAWIASFGLRLYLPSTGNLLIWFPDTIFEEGLGFVVDYLNWPYMVAVLGICVAALLTDTTRADPGINPYSWVQTVSITGLKPVCHPGCKSAHHGDCLDGDRPGRVVYIVRITQID